MTAPHRRSLLSALCVPTLLAAAIAHAQEGDSARLLDEVTVIAERGAWA